MSENVDSTQVPEPKNKDNFTFYAGTVGIIGTIALIAGGLYTIGDHLHNRFKPFTYPEGGTTLLSDPEKAVVEEPDGDLIAIIRPSYQMTDTADACSDALPSSNQRLLNACEAALSHTIGNAGNMGDRVIPVPKTGENLYKLGTTLTNAEITQEQLLAILDTEYKGRMTLDEYNQKVTTITGIFGFVATAIILAGLERRFKFLNKLASRQRKKEVDSKSKKSRRKEIVLDPFKDNIPIPNDEEPTKYHVKSDKKAMDTLHQNLALVEAAETNTVGRKYGPSEVIQHILKSTDFKEVVDEQRKHNFANHAHAFDKTDGIGREKEESPSQYEYDPDQIYRHAIGLIRIAIHTNPQLSIHDLKEAREGLLAEAYSAIITATVIGGERKTLPDHLYYHFFQQRQSKRFGNK